MWRYLTLGTLGADRRHSGAGLNSNRAQAFAKYVRRRRRYERKVRYAVSVEHTGPCLALSSGDDKLLSTAESDRLLEAMERGEIT